MLGFEHPTSGLKRPEVYHKTTLASESEWCCTQQSMSNHLQYGSGQRIPQFGKNAE